MSDLQTRSLQLAVLSTGTNMELARSIIDATVAPVAGAQGYDVGGALYGTLRVHMRRFGPAMTSDLYITTEDLTTAVTYALTVNGTTATYAVPGSPPADLSALCEAIASDINGTATVQDLVTATAIQRDANGNTSGTTYNTVRVIWKAPESPTAVVWAISGATARAEVINDPETARVRVYGAWLTPSVSTRLADLADDLAAATSWEILRGNDGSVADITLTAGLGYPMPVYVAEVNSVRAYVTAVANTLVTTTSATTIPTITTRNPVVLVTYGRVAS
jgi:hypothetical protein